MTLYRVAVVSDTHLPRGARAFPDGCLEQLRAADLIAHAGDFVTVGILRELQVIGPPVIGVRGNVDEPALALLPETTRLPLPDARIGLIHDAGPAAGRLARLRRRFSDCSVVIFGHSHIPLHEHAAGFQIFNPGSPTDPRRQPRPTMGIATVKAGVVNLELLTL